jgi:large subunit ribosomal protein L21
MLAVFKTGGKQYSVKAGQILKVEKLEGVKGDSISFNDVLAVSDNSNHTIGTPLVKGAKIKAKILEQIRDKKIIVFKKRQRQNYRHTQGHRQYLTVLQIEAIALGDKESSAPVKKVTKNKSEEKKVVEEVTSSKKAVTKKTAPKKTSSIKKTAVKKKSASKKEIKE